MRVESEVAFERNEDTREALAAEKSTKAAKGELLCVT